MIVCEFSCELLRGIHRKIYCKQMTRASGLTRRKSLLAKLLLWNCCYEVVRDLLVELLFRSCCYRDGVAVVWELLWIYCLGCVVGDRAAVKSYC